MTPDADLARAAQGGDAAALGVLLERHRAALIAHALQLVGHAEAHDAVQDTFVVAMRRIGAVRDPAAIEGWLHVVLRNACLDRLRARTDVAAETPDLAAPAADEPESIIDSLALRDWVWTAVGRLSEPLRLVTMLRHFSQCSAYDDIARVCDIPVGTVRSRLNEARRRLADDLLTTAARSHDEAARRTRDQRAHWSRVFQDPDDLADGAAVDVEVRKAAGGVFHGRETLRAGIYDDFAHGVGFILDDVLAGPGITIVEGRFRNPPEDPDHCPPATSQVAFFNGDLVQRMVWHYAPRPLRAEDVDGRPAG